MWLPDWRTSLVALKERSIFARVHDLRSLVVIYCMKPPHGLDPYHLVFTPATVIASLKFFISVSLYREAVGSLVFLTTLVAIGIAVVTANAQARRRAAFGFASFVVMLGPTLFLVTTDQTSYHRTYLYAPHFFLALSLAALLGNNVLSTIIATAAIVVVLVAPITDGSRSNFIAFQQEKSRVNRAQFQLSAILAPRAGRRCSLMVSKRFSIRSRTPRRALSPLPSRTRP